MPHPLLYQINTRCWLRRLSTQHNRTVTLADVPDAEIDGWQKLGFTQVWAMGVWTTGPLCRAQALENTALQNTFTKVLPGWGKQDVTGSPYAIGSYEVPELLGGNEGLKRFRRQLNARGMKLLLDFVPNHLGLDHPWVIEKPEMFLQSPEELPGTFQQLTRNGVRWLAHGKDPHFPPWSDTVQLDYRRDETQAAMIELLRSIAPHCDGVRCDMAMLMMNEVFTKTWAHFPGGVTMPKIEFWTKAIQTVRQSHPEFIFLAEVYWGLEARLQELGFDYTYAKTVCDRLVDQRHGELQRELLSAHPDWLERSAHFLENHDERRAAAVFSMGEHRAAALLMLGLPGMRMIYEGQLSGARLQIPVHLARWPSEDTDVEIAAMYHQLLAVLKDSAVGHGKFQMLSPKAAADDTKAQNFIVVQWQKSPEQFDLVVVNLAAEKGQCRVQADIVGLGAYDWEARDLLGSELHRHHGGDLEGQGIRLALPAHGAQLLRFQRV